MRRSRLQRGEQVGTSQTQSLRQEVSGESQRDNAGSWSRRQPIGRAVEVRVRLRQPTRNSLSAKSCRQQTFGFQSQRKPVNYSRPTGVYFGFTRSRLFARSRVRSSFDEFLYEAFRLISMLNSESKLFRSIRHISYAKLIDFFGVAITNLVFFSFQINIYSPYTSTSKRYTLLKKSMLIRVRDSSTESSDLLCDSCEVQTCTRCW